MTAFCFSLPTWFTRLSRLLWLMVAGVWLVGAPGRAQVTLKVILEPDEVTYSVYMTSSVTYTGFPALIGTAQITLLVPHGTGPDRFAVADLTSPVPNMRWLLNTRIDAPPENPQVDYLFFSFINTSTPVALFDIPAGQPLLLFQFRRTSPCLGGVQLIDNRTDLFLPPNSARVNSGNTLSVLAAARNVYRGNTDAPPAVRIRLPAGVLCAGQATTFTASLDPVPVEVVVYEWFMDEKSLAPASDDPQLVYALPPRAGLPVPVLRVRATVRGATRCRDQTVTAVQKLTIADPPNAAVTYTGEVCTALPLVLPAAVTAGAAYQWLQADTPIAGAEAASLTVTASGQYRVRVTAGGCSAVSSPVRIVGVPAAERTTVTLGSAQTLVAGASVGLQARVTNAASFTWTPTTGLSSPLSLSPVAMPRQTTIYTLRAESAAGCPAQDSVRLTVLPGLLIPDVFSPNGDGINDTWVVYNTDRYQFCAVTVANRWGTVIFHSQAYAVPGWDGKLANGQPAESGVYQYLIRTEFGQQRGSLYLSR